MQDIEDRARKLTELATREASDVADISRLMVIRNQEQYQRAGATLREVKERIATLENKRKEITRPLDAAKKGIMDLFREPLDYLKEGEASIKRALGSFLEEEETKRQAKLERIATVDPKEARALVLEVGSSQAPVADGVQARTILDFEIENESLLPRQFLIPCEKKIRASVKAGLEVPGVRVFEKTQISARRSA